jgi:hypothetical protein
MKGFSEESCALIQNFVTGGKVNNDVGYYSLYFVKLVAKIDVSRY